MVREYTAEFKLEAVKLANEQRKASQTIRACPQTRKGIVYEF